MGNTFAGLTVERPCQGTFISHQIDGQRRHSEIQEDTPGDLQLCCLHADTLVFPGATASRDKQLHEVHISAEPGESLYR